MTDSLNLPAASSWSQWSVFVVSLNASNPGCSALIFDNASHSSRPVCRANCRQWKHERPLWFDDKYFAWLFTVLRDHWPVITPSKHSRPLQTNVVYCTRLILFDYHSQEDVIVWYLKSVSIGLLNGYSYTSINMLLQCPKLNKFLAEAKVK